MNKVVSADGTPIAYERSGEGPALILVGGAFGVKDAAAPLASLLAPHFTTIAYDRRGRGDSGDAPAYSVGREIEDLGALLAEVGGAAFVYGHSSGAALALAAAAAGLPITGLALYEPPFIVDGTRPPIPAGFGAKLSEFVAAGRPGDAVAAFWREAMQMPAETIEQARKAPMWAGLEALAHTLPYDVAIVEANQKGRPLPTEWSTLVTVPTLVMDGGASPVFQGNSVAALTRLLPHAERRTFEGQGHGAPAEVLAPVLVEFFRR
jgi:pimeloyl-ACP methyl ester carboxylesterase